MKVNIRNEKESDYQAVEDMTRKAFYKPICNRGA